jgi:hypothetical protein
LLLHTAQELGIRVPVTRQISSEFDVSRWFSEGESSAVLKMDGTSGGEGVAIVHSESEALEAFRRLTQPLGWAKVLKRLAVNREPFDLRRTGDTSAALSIQQFVSGRPANAMFACWEGEVLSVVAVEVLASQGTTGAAILVRRIVHAEMERAAHMLAQRLGLSGFYGLDFLLDDAGRVYLIEMNPRCTQLGHLRFSTDSDLAGAFCAKLTGHAVPDTVPLIGDRAVAFFPLAHRLCPNHPLLAGAYADIPQNQPALERGLEMKSWPERSLIAQVYHHFRPPEKVVGVVFKTEAEATIPQSGLSDGTSASAGSTLLVRASD